jgi:SAM-dependent methyltransferase
LRREARAFGQRDTAGPHGASFWRGVGRQLACPSGWPGRLIGRVMALVNRGPNRATIGALDIAPGDTILELGFGPGRAIRTMAALAVHGRVLGVDQSPEMLAQASRSNRAAIRSGRVRLALGRFDALPHTADSVDKILAVNVAYFFRDGSAEISEARRVLRPGGVMAVYVTHESTMSHWKFCEPETHRLFDGEGLRRLLLEGGFGAGEIELREMTLPFGVNGLLAIVRKRRDMVNFS